MRRKYKMVGFVWLLVEHPLMVNPCNCEKGILLRDGLLHFVLIPSFWQFFQIASYCVSWLFSSAAPSYHVEDGKFRQILCCWWRLRLFENGITQKPVRSGSYHSAHTRWQHLVFQSWCAVHHRGWCVQQQRFSKKRFFTWASIGGFL